MNQCNDNPHFSEKEIFKIALNARDFEIKMFWQRCNYFLLLNSAVGAAVGATLASKNISVGIIPFLCAIGMFVCLAWIKVGLGAKFWQTHWENIVVKFQADVGLTGDNDIFSPANIYKHVNESLKIQHEPERNVKCESRGEFISYFKEECKLFFRLFRLYPSNNDYDKGFYQKPSVSRWMHKTACFFFLVWSTALVITILHILFCLFCKITVSS